jgi:hypothetical protein
LILYLLRKFVDEIINRVLDLTRRKKVRLINHNSLALTLDAVNEAFFLKRPLSESTRVQSAQWIASRQGMLGSYANMFAPTRQDFRNGLFLFTGEKTSSRVGVSHILGQESSRTLILLGVKSADIKKALEKATAGFMEWMKKYLNVNKGTYCCATCSCAFWRHLSAGGLENGEQILTAGIGTLKSYRDGKSRWKRFPFYYTLLTLHDIDLPAARKEMQYAAPACERLLKREMKRDKINQRRYILAEKILEGC